MVSAVVLAGGGVVILTMALNAGLRANVDAALHTRAETYAADISAGNIEHTDPGPTFGSVTSGEDLTSVIAVLDAAGNAVFAQPSRLPAWPGDIGTGPTETAVSTQFGGAPFRLLTVPVHRGDGTWHIIAGQNLEPVNDAAASIRSALLIALPILLALAGAGAWLLSGAALRPVERMRADAQRLAASSDRIEMRDRQLTEPGTGDNLARLARTFNQLLDKLHRAVEQQRDLVADAGHELRTPLAVLKMELETAVRPQRTRDDLASSIQHARTEVERLIALSEDLLLLAQSDGRSDIVAREVTDIHTVVETVVADHLPMAQSRAIQITVQCPTDLHASVDPAGLRRAVANLVNNSIRYASSQVSIDVVRGSRDSGTLTIGVSDDGPGFPSEFLPRAFERFARADQGRSRADPATGSGLGLAVVRALVMSHGGRVDAANRPGAGAVVTISIPIGHPG